MRIRQINNVHVNAGKQFPSRFDEARRQKKSYATIWSFHSGEIQIYLQDTKNEVSWPASLQEGEKLK